MLPSIALNVLKILYIYKLNFILFFCLNELINACAFPRDTLCTQRNPPDGAGQGREDEHGWV